MSAIYGPKGRAREYSPLALNLYNGCDHGCTYCYARGMAERFGRSDQWDRPIPRAGIVQQIERDARKIAHSPNQVLLCFTGDPYCRAEMEHEITRAVLPVLYTNRIPVAVLTKGGKRCLRDLDLFQDFGPHIKVGATLTFCSPRKSREWEPGAALPEDRFGALWKLHINGIKTWASLEPIIDPAETLEIIRETNGYIDAYKLGRWNHDQRAERTDWPGFLAEAVPLLRGRGKPLYVKECLRPYISAAGIKLSEAEMNPDALALPPFPADTLPPTRRDTAPEQAQLSLVLS